MSDAVIVALLLALIWKFTDFLKQAVAGNLNGVLTQLIAWVAGFVAVVLFAHSAFAPHLVLNGLRFDHVSWVDQLLAGLTVGSAGSASYDVKKALDQTDTAATPRLLRPRVTPPPP